jgi:pimeloyl-ACP methyl ester carboxylesterase
MPFQVLPFTIAIPDTVIEDLAYRLDHVRWPHQNHDAGWAQGTDVHYLRELVHHWRNVYDWRVAERELNRWPQYTVDIDGCTIHFIHVRAGRAHPRAIPLVLTHGWPSSFTELVGLIAPLTDPELDGVPAFDVVIPSLPRFGFSGIPDAAGEPRIDTLWRKLMVDVLGYPEFVAHGTDIGARITSCLGRFHGDVVRAIHLGSVDLEWPSPLPDDAQLTPAERAYLKRADAWDDEEGGYSHQQSTRPQTLAYGLNDSPVGLAAWIVEKYRAWSDCDGQVENCFTKDEMLTNILVYWATQTIGPSMRRYREMRVDPPYPRLGPGERIETPTGVAMFPGERELVVPKEWAERCYNLVHWTDMPRGGHFPAIEQPRLLVDDLRAFFGGLRPASP